jgi:hypothetical protein
MFSSHKTASLVAH